MQANYESTPQSDQKLRNAEVLVGPLVRPSVAKRAATSGTGTVVWSAPKALFAIAVLLTQACASPLGDYLCNSSDECSHGAVDGRCETTKHCSFPDETCGGGYRFGTASGDDSGSCVQDQLDAGGACECEDSVFCTEDSCDSDGECVNEPNDGLCTVEADGICDRLLDCQYTACYVGNCQPLEQCQNAQCNSSDQCVRTLNCLPDVTEDFETMDSHGGLGWAGPWLTTTSATIRFFTNAAHTGTGVLDMRAGGYASRSVDLSGYTNAQLELWARVIDFEAGDTLDVLVSTDNAATFTTVHTYTQEDESPFHVLLSVDLSSLPVSSTSVIAFDAKMESENDSDTVYIDDILMYDAVCSASVLQGCP